MSASHLRVGMRGVRLALGDVRFGDDAAWLHIGRLDGRRTARPRRAVIVRVFPVSGPPAMVHEPCKAGIHVVGDTAAVVTDPVWLVGASALVCAVAVWLWWSLHGMEQSGVPRAVVVAVPVAVPVAIPVAIPVAMVVAMSVYALVDARSGGDEPTVVGRIRFLVIVIGIPAMTWVTATRRRR